MNIAFRVLFWCFLPTRNIKDCLKTITFTSDSCCPLKTLGLSQLNIENKNHHVMQLMTQTIILTKYCNMIYNFSKAVGGSGLKFLNGVVVIAVAIMHFGK